MCYFIVWTLSGSHLTLLFHEQSGLYFISYHKHLFILYFLTAITQPLPLLMELDFLIAFDVHHLHEHYNWLPFWLFYTLIMPRSVCVCFCFLPPFQRTSFLNSTHTNNELFHFLLANAIWLRWILHPKLFTTVTEWTYLLLF